MQFRIYVGIGLILLLNATCNANLHSRKPPLLNRDLRVPKEILKNDGRNDLTNSVTVPSPAKTSSVSNWTNNISTGVNFALWYFISAFYNVYNKKALNCLQMPLLVATVQMGTGIFLFLPLWLLKVRPTPFSTLSELRELLWRLVGVASFVTLSHISGVIALNTGTVSFTQVVKSVEPVFTALIAAIFSRQFLSYQAYSSLMLVIIGVGIASANELTFSWFSLSTGLISSLFAAARCVFSKFQMSGGGSNKRNGNVAPRRVISSENYYSVIVMLSLAMLIPIMIAKEGNQIMTTLNILYKTEILKIPPASLVSNSLLPKSMSTINSNIRTIKEGLWYALCSGFLYYMYNELSFRVLGKVNPVTHAVANTAKRVVIILSSLIIFNNPLNLQGKVGSTLSILGVFAYSLAQYYDNIKKKHI